MDLWGYDPSTNLWTQKTSFPGAARANAFGFSIGTKGYFGGGEANNFTLWYQDFWEYDNASNSWTQKTDFPPGKRVDASSFSIGQIGYVGLGNDSVHGFRYDLWGYNVDSNSWTQKLNFGGGFRDVSTGFSIGIKGYFGTGMGSNPKYKNDLWEYDPNGWSGINELTNPIKTTLYPNPFFTQTTLTISGVVETHCNASLQIYDASGKEVKNISIGDKKQITINRAGLENGVYFIELKIGEERIVKKMVVD